MNESTQENPTFEEALGRLETIVAALERGDLDLAESLGRYEQGVALLARCQKMLDGVDRSVSLLTGVEADGSAILEPFDASATPPLDASSAPAPAPTVVPKPRRRRPTAAVEDDADDDEPPF